MLPSPRKATSCIAAILLVLNLLLWLPTAYRSRSSAPANHRPCYANTLPIAKQREMQPIARSENNTPAASAVSPPAAIAVTTASTAVTAASTNVTAASAAVTAPSKCPQGYFVTINAAGRLGNKLCQYASLWCLQQDDTRARPTWILPEMQRALAPLFSGLSLPALPEVCTNRNSSDFWKLSYFKFTRDVGAGPLPRPLLLTDHPCDLSRFARHIQPLLQQLELRAEVREEAQRQLRRHTNSLCRGPPDCTFIGVHVRRTDYAQQVKRVYNKTLAGEKYLARALELCRRRYRRPVFVVCSDDLAWVRQRLHGPDVVIAGSTGADSAGRDLALLAQCNHTVVTHGTYGFMASFLAQGDALLPAGFGARASSFIKAMQARGFNTTEVPAF